MKQIFSYHRFWMHNPVKNQCFWSPLITVILITITYLNLTHCIQLDFTMLNLDYTLFCFLTSYKSIEDFPATNYQQERGVRASKLWHSWRFGDGNYLWRLWLALPHRGRGRKATVFAFATAAPIKTCTFPVSLLTATALLPLTCFQSLDLRH